MNRIYLLCVQEILDSNKFMVPKELAARWHWHEESIRRLLRERRIASKPLTAKVVHQAAAEFKPRPVKSAKAKKKPVLVPRPNLKTAFELIDDIEKLAEKNQRLLVKVAALRDCMLAIG